MQSTILRGYAVLILLSPSLPPTLFLSRLCSVPSNPFSSSPSRTFFTFQRYPQRFDVGDQSLPKPLPPNFGNASYLARRCRRVAPLLLLPTNASKGKKVSTVAEKRAILPNFCYRFRNDNRVRSASRSAKNSIHPSTSASISWISFPRLDFYSRRVQDGVIAANAVVRSSGIWPLTNSFAIFSSFIDFSTKIERRKDAAWRSARKEPAKRAKFHRARSLNEYRQ